VRTKALVNLCFHGIGQPGRELEDGESRYWISVPQFEDILDDVMSWSEVRISFDDGNESDVEHGLPALRRRNLTATFFIVAGRLDTPGSLRAEDVRDLATNGMRIGSHGMDHRPWPGLDHATTQRELVEARSQIADLAGTVVEEAALPLGRYDRRLISRLHSAGYRRIHTSDRRVASQGAWIQPRFSVRKEDSPNTIRAEVAAARRPMRRVYLGAVGTVKRWR
jgi:peptidoglycan/xylan/chitin deacetylase (PgdA/CDA1 family)